jgi:hypothetical protein
VKVIISVYEDGNKVHIDKHTFIIADEADLIQKNEDIGEYLLDQLHQMEEYT